MDIVPNSGNGIYCSKEMEGKCERKGTLLSSCITLFCTTMGVGIIISPYGYTQTGYIFGLHLLSRCILTCGVYPSSFYVVTHIAAPNWTVLIDLAVAVKCFLLATSYLMVVGDNIPDAVDSIMGSTYHPRWLNFRVIITIGVVMVIPLVCQKDFKVLRYSSIMTALFVVYLAVIVILNAVRVLDPFGGDDVCHGEIISASFAPSHVLPVLSIFVLSFTCQHNLFSVCNELHDINMPRLNFIIRTTMGFCLISYLIVALSVYWTFGSCTLPDFLRNYPVASPYVGFARFGLSLSVLMGYSLQVLPCRRSVISLVQAMQAWWLRKFPPIVTEVQYSTMEMNENGIYKTSTHVPFPESEEDDSGYLVDGAPTGNDDTAERPLVGTIETPMLYPDSAGLFLFSAVTVCIVMFSYIIAISGIDLHFVLEFAGAIGSTSITYIIPGFLYMKLHTCWNLRRVAALFLLTAGCLIVPVCIIFIILAEERI